MKKRKLVLNEEEKYTRSWQDCREIWINKWNIICVKFVAFVSFSCIIGLIIVRSINFSSNDENIDYKPKSALNYNDIFINQTIFIQHVHGLPRKMRIYENGCNFYMSSYWGPTRCTFNCSGTDSNQIVPTIQTIYNQEKCSDGIILHLTNMKFEDDVLRKDWWSIPVPITHLFFSACELKDIESDAFINMADTKTIRFSRSQIPFYRKDMFKGLIQLSDLEFADSSLAPNPTPNGVKYEFGLLEYVKNSLVTLQVQDSIQDEEAIRNLTGIYLPNIEIIDFRFNKKLTYIPSDGFNTPNLKKIHLDGCYLQGIHSNAFKNAPIIQIMNLHKNNLEILTENTFYSFQKFGNITIRDNDWFCTCDLQFLQKYFYINDFETTVCKDGTLLQTIFEHCSPTTTTSEKPGTEPKTTTPNKPDPETTPNKPTEPPNTETTNNPAVTTVTETTTPRKTTVETTTSKKEDFTTTTTTRSLGVQSTCKSISKNFHVDGEDDKVIVKYTGELEPKESLYFMTTNKDNCDFTNSVGTINTTDTPYIMCKLSDKNLECFSGKTESAESDKTWLRNRDMAPMLAITTLSTVIVSILTGIGVYYSIKRRLIRKRKAKRQIFQQEIVKPVYLMPYQREPPIACPVPPVPVCCRERHLQYDSAYLTPISQRYMRIQEYDTPLKRSLSDLSVRTVASYVTENQISTRPDIEEAPPLPPPRIRHSHEIHDQYKSTNYW